MNNKNSESKTSRISAAALAGIPDQNIIFDCHLPHAELMDATTGMAWHSRHPMSRDEYHSLEVPEGMHKVGIGTAVPDAHYFRRSPGADCDSAVTTRDIGGYPFIHNANRPLDKPKPLGEKWPLMIKAVKFHTLIFAAGRDIDVIKQPDGADFVALIAPAPKGGSLFQAGTVPEDIEAVDLPPGWSRRTETCKQELVIHLPYPTEALFFPNGASYQGPVNVFNSDSK